MSGTRVDSAVTVSSISAGDSSGSSKLGGSGYMISPPFIDLPQKIGCSDVNGKYIYIYIYLFVLNFMSFLCWSEHELWVLNRNYLIQ